MAHLKKPTIISHTKSKIQIYLFDQSNLTNGRNIERLKSLPGKIDKIFFYIFRPRLG